MEQNINILFIFYFILYRKRPGWLRRRVPRRRLPTTSRHSRSLPEWRRSTKDCLLLFLHIHSTMSFWSFTSSFFINMIVFFFCLFLLFYVCQNCHWYNSFFRTNFRIFSHFIHEYPFLFLNFFNIIFKKNIIKPINNNWSIIQSFFSFFSFFHF